MNNPLAILILITGLAIGSAVLIFAFRIMKVEKEVDAKHAEAAQPQPDPAPAVTAAPPESAPPSPSPPPPPDPGFVELGRLLRTPDGLLVLQANNNWYLRRQDIADPQLLAALDEFSRFLQNDDLPPLVARPPLADAEPPAQPKPTEMVDGRPTVFMTAREAAQVPLTTPSLDIMRQYRYLRERDKQPQIVIKSVLEEIDEILQAAIADTALAKRGLKVSADSGGTALFFIDGKSYSGVEELPEAEARVAVKAAIQEWERKK
jgi:hypothetical protein